MLRLALVEHLSGWHVQTLRARQDRDAARSLPRAAGESPKPNGA
jgi:hypothetical protein